MKISKHSLSIALVLLCGTSCASAPPRDDPRNSAQEMGTRFLYEIAWITQATDIPNWAYYTYNRTDSYKGFWDSKDYHGNLPPIIPCAPPGSSEWGKYQTLLTVPVKMSERQVREAADRLEKKAAERGLKLETRDRDLDIDSWDEIHLAESVAMKPKNGVRINLVSKDMRLHVNFTPSSVEIAGTTSCFKKIDQNRSETGEFIPSRPVPRPPARTDGRKASDAYNPGPKFYKDFP